MNKSNAGTKHPSRRQGTLALAASGLILNSLTLVRGVVFVPLYLHYIGAELYGAWLASGSLVAYLGLFDCGLNSVLYQKVAAAYGAGDTPRLSRYFGSGLLMVVSLAPLPALVGIICAPYLPRLLAVPSAETQVLTMAFLLASCAASVMIVGHALGGIVCALQRQSLHGKIWIAATVVGLMVTVTLLLSGYSLISLPLGILVQSCFVLVMEGAVFWHLQKRILACSSLSPGWETIVELMKPSTTMFLGRGGATLAGQSDNLLIGMYLGSRAVLVYDLTKRAFEVLRVLYGYTISSFAPALAHFFGEMQGETTKGRALAETLIHISAVTGLVLTGGYVILNRSFVSLWVGPGFYAGDLVVILIGIYGLLSAQTLPLYQIVFSSGRLYTAALATGAEGLLRIGLLLIVTPWWGLPGVALAAVVSLTVTGWGILWHRYCRDFNLSWSEAFRYMLPLASVGVGILAIGLFFRHLGTPITIPVFLSHCAFYLGAASLWVVLVDRRMRGLAADFLHHRPLVFSGPP